MKSFLKQALTILPLVYLAVSPTAFSEEPNSIKLKGSDTMVNLGQAWAEAFMGKNPSALIAVTGGGSGTGIAALLNGTCDIVQSSREMTVKERELGSQKGLDVQEVKVGIDALAVVVHPENPIRQLSIEQLSNIFTGKIKNWKDLGGKDESILVLSRERNSGTHVYFLEEVVRRGNKSGPEEFAPTVLMMPSSQAIEQEVAGNQAAIGYFGLGYLNPRVRALDILQKNTAAYVSPSVDGALSSAYPLSRPLLFYLPHQPEGLVKQFVDFVLSQEGQAIVLDMHFVPLRKE